MSMCLQLGESTHLKLTQALLIYTGHDTAFVSVHEVMAADGAPIIGPGQALGADQLTELMRQVSNAPTERRILSERVLFSDASMVMFWVPASRRKIWFGKSATLEAVSGTEVKHPPLLMIAQPGSLSVFALRKNQRPTGSTELYRAPYFNLYTSGAMCRGNVALPEQLDPSEDGLAAWEAGFFGSNFTHSNYHGVPITNARGGHDGLWTRQAKGQQAFPVASLIPLGITVSDLLRKGAPK